MLSSMLQIVCHSLSDGNQVVRSAGLFALGQFSEHLQVRLFIPIHAVHCAAVGVCKYEDVQV